MVLTRRGVLVGVLIGVTGASFGSSAGRPVFGDKMSGFAARAVRGGL